MATQGPITGAPPRASGNPATSTILALHARYEAALQEFERLSLAQPKQPPEGASISAFTPYFAFERGMEANSREQDVLREAIFYQTPTTDEDLTVLAFHAWMAGDSGFVLDEAALIPLGIGLTSIFNYLASKAPSDMEKIGPAFRDCAKLAFERVNMRTGQLEDVA